MLAAVFTISVLNLALGAALAVLADRPWRLALPAWPRWGSAVPAPLPAVEAGTAPVEEDWQQVLHDQGLVADSWLEALLWVMHLELPALRARYEPVDSRLADPQDPELLDNELQQAISRWMQRLNLWVAVLRQGESAAVPPSLQHLPLELQEQLLDAVYHVEQASEGLQHQARKESVDCGQAALLVNQLFRTADALRVFVSAQLADLLRETGRLETADWQQGDAESGCLSRLGLELLFTRWLEDDAQHARMLSCVLVDVDRTGQLNDRLGTVGGDHVLAALGTLLRDLVRKERGFDRVVRYTGQSFLLFLGDTEGNNAVKGAERIRQSIEVTAFEWAGNPVELTVSLGVADVKRQEPLPDFLVRLEAAAAEAKNAGRNRTVVDDGQGSLLTAAARYLVARKEVAVSD